MLSSKIFKDGYAVSSSILAKSEKNDCVVRACANAFNIQYDTAHQFVKERFDRKSRQGVKATYSILKELCDEITCFGLEDGDQLSLFGSDEQEYEIKYIVSSPKTGGKLYNRKYTHKKVAYTVKTLLQKYTKGTYIVLVNKHALVIKDGVLIDNSNTRYGGYRRTVESAFKVITK